MLNNCANCDDQGITCYECYLLYRGEDRDAAIAKAVAASKDDHPAIYEAIAFGGSCLAIYWWGHGFISITFIVICYFLVLGEIRK